MKLLNRADVQSAETEINEEYDFWKFLQIKKNPLEL